MSPETAETIRLCEVLPEDKRAEVMDFARFLLSKTEHSDDLAWEQRLSDPARRPTLEAFLHDSAAEGGDEPLKGVNCF